ncbi:MAG TPA: UbiD family decarboxylase [Candidatus Aenigmarchaeota archaeon]|nr:UbiD family decarboxylase [Candidatus Aenigmarchaeota archaeon]
MFRKFVEVLDKKGLLLKIKKQVSRRYEIATLMKKLDGKPLFFEHVKGSDYKVVANIASTRDLVALALGVKKEELKFLLADAIDNSKPCKVKKAHGYEDIGNDITKLPVLLHYKKDGGPYLSSSIVVATHEKYGINASYHRMMVIARDKLAIRILPRHFDTYLNEGVREFAICIGVPMQVMLAAAISCELGKSELDIANAIKPTELIELDGFLVPESEFVIIAEITNERSNEGPFVDLTGTYDIVRKERVARIKKIYAKPNALYHALLPGGLEHKILMGMPREPTIYREVSKVVECKDVYITPGGCSWLHAVVSVKKRSKDDGKKAIEAAFKGHSSLKHVVVVDDDINIYKPEEVEWAIATRFQADKDLVIKKGEKGSSLDPSADPITRKTTKWGIDATIPFDRERDKFLRAREPMNLEIKNYLG